MTYFHMYFPTKLLKNAFDVTDHNILGMKITKKAYVHLKKQVLVVFNDEKNQ